MSGFILWMTLVLPSVYVLERRAGWMAVVVQAFIAAVAIWGVPRLVRRLPHRALPWAAAATLILVVVVFAVVYPLVNVHEPGLGSDDDDAHNIGALALMHGTSPYDETTYLGNPLHQLPGSFVLAAPFVLLGTSALQNLVWLPLFFLAVRRETGDSRGPLALAWIVLVGSPTVLHQVVTGSSYLTNTISVLLGLWWLMRTRHRLLAATLWGVTLASRANFLFLLPLAFGWIARRDGWRAAVATTGLAGLVIAVLTLPFYFHDPSQFGPLEAANRLAPFNQLVPHGDWLFLAAMGALSVALAVRPTDSAGLFEQAAWIQALPITAGTLAASFMSGRFDAFYLAYGTFFAWFAWMMLSASAHRGEPQSTI